MTLVSLPSRWPAPCAGVHLPIGSAWNVITVPGISERSIPARFAETASLTWQTSKGTWGDVMANQTLSWHDDVIKWKHFPRYWLFVRGIHWPPVNSPHKGQWRGALMFSLISAWINGWVNNREAGDKRCHRTHYDLIVMSTWVSCL